MSATSRAPLIDAARDPACRRVRAAALLQGARTTVKGAAQIKPVRALIHDPATGGQGLAFGASVRVHLVVTAVVRSREGAVLALGLVDDGDMRLDLLLIHEPMQHLGRAVGTV